MRQRLHPAHILIVEDDEDYGKALQKLLKNDFEVVDVTGNCTEAVARIGGALAFYDMVIMDQNLEGKQNGIECMRNIKRINGNIEVIMLTGYGERDLALEALRDGAFRYFYKPANEEELSATIYAAYELSHLRKINVSLKEGERELKNSVSRVILVSLVANISILSMALLIREQFMYAAVSFIAILAILFCGWQGIGKVILDWKESNKRFTLNIETVKDILGKKRNKVSK